MTTCPLVTFVDLCQSFCARTYLLGVVSSAQAVRGLINGQVYGPDKEVRFQVGKNHKPRATRRIYFEQAKSIYLTPHEFLVDSGLLTATQKKTRIAFYRTFNDEINRPYRGEIFLNQTSLWLAVNID